MGVFTNKTLYFSPHFQFVRLKEGAYSVRYGSPILETCSNCLKYKKGVEVNKLNVL